MSRFDGPSFKKNLLIKHLNYTLSQLLIVGRLLNQQLTAQGVREGGGRHGWHVDEPAANVTY